MVATVAGYSSAHSVISVEPALAGRRTVQNDDLLHFGFRHRVCAMRIFYRIERYQSRQCDKFDIAAPSVPV
ncbi:MAG: hypothetical protein R2941_11520 [Desulfobacterales bacterium]